MKMTIIYSFILTLLLTTTAQPLSFSHTEIAGHHVGQLSKMIAAIQPGLKEHNRKRIATALYKTAKNHKLDPKIMIAIISTESDFENSRVSPTGDLSLAQINIEIWNKEFSRLGLKQLNKKLLKTNEAYALNKMAEILNIIKSRHAKNDNKWFARYHSHTKKYKDIYNLKLEKKLRMIASVN